MNLSTSRNSDFPIQAPSKKSMGVGFDVAVVDDLEGPLGPDERSIRHMDLLDLYSGLKSYNNSMGGEERSPWRPVLPAPYASLAAELPRVDAPFLWGCLSVRRQLLLLDAWAVDLLPGQPASVP